VGKLARWLRLLGFDTLFFKGENDRTMVEIAQTEKRIILTRDTRLMQRRPIAGRQVKALLLTTDNAYEQEQKTLTEFDLKSEVKPFSLCLECNQTLVSVDRENVQTRVPPYVSQSQLEYVECPKCRRVYWKGTHWTAMREQLNRMKII
jgi:uncharacterized protein with PIN domain